MNKTIFSVVAAAIMASGYAKADELAGQVTDNDGRPVEFVTVVALNNEREQGGAVTDSIGNYRFSVPEGRYKVCFSLLGLEPLEKEIEVKGATRLDVTMQESGVALEGVEVRASAIRRLPDRFVVNVEDMPASIGKNGKELLQEAPGVWIDDDKVAIYGKSGVKVYVNDRELKLDNDQLQHYLKSLRAEDVSKVEVIPQAGSEYSADTSAGIIRITLKRNRADGVMGNVGMSVETGKDMTTLNPSFAINIKNGKWSYNLNANMTYFPKMTRNMEEVNHYENGDIYNTTTVLDADNLIVGNAQAGVFYDPNEKNAFGLELSYFRFRNPALTSTNANFLYANGEADALLGRYGTKDINANFDATFNYTYRLDNQGSNMKFIANYNRSDNRSRKDNNQHREDYLGVSSDSLSWSLEHTNFDVMNFSYDFNKIFNPKWNMAAGMKYTRNKMDNDAYYESRLGDMLPWRVETSRNYDENYTENIYGVYAKASTHLGRFMATVGLRGEATDAGGHGSIVKQNYFDIFPNANFTLLLDEAGANNLTLQYSRSISRPSFWALNPVKFQASDYFYHCGNPDLKPSYENNITLTAVMKYKYSLTVWAAIKQDPMMQGSMVDPENPHNVLFTTLNAENFYTYGAYLGIPLQPTKWLTINTGLTYIYQGERLNVGGDLNYNSQFFANGSVGIQLPADFYFTTQYFYRHKTTSGEINVNSMHFLNASLKKSFANGKWNASVGVNNILGKPSRFSINSAAGYVSETKVEMPLSVHCSLTYNFNAGKMFQAKRIEKNDDPSRKAKSEGVN